MMYLTPHVEQITLRPSVIGQNIVVEIEMALFASAEFKGDILYHQV